MNDRTTSHAKNVIMDTDRADDLLRQYGYVKHTFDHARDPSISRQLNDEAAAKRAAEDRGENSWMVSTDAPRDVYRPPEDIARPVDRETHQNRMGEDDRRARAQALVDRYALNERPYHEQPQSHSNKQDYSQT